MCKLFYFDQDKRDAVMFKMNIEKDKFYSIRKLVLKRFKDLLPWKTFSDKSA
jgi:hypothetical protein